MPGASKPEASDFTLKGQASSQHGFSCQHLPLASGMVPASFPFYGLGERWLQGGLIFNETVSELWTSAFSQLPVACPTAPAHQLVWSPRRIRAGPGLAGWKQEIGSVNTGDLKRAENSHATVTHRCLFLLPRALMTVLPHHTHGPATALNLHQTTTCITATALQLVPILCPPSPYARPPAGTS